MSSVLENTTNPQQMLRALDPNLPFLASEAAIELDNLLLAQTGSLDNVKLLAERLKNTSEKVDGDTTRRALMDLPTVEVISAVFMSQGHQVKTLNELVQEAWSISGNLERSGAEQDRALIAKTRDFCVALSKCASSYYETVTESGQTEAPWGR